MINPVKDTLELLFQFAGLNHETLALARVILISTMIKVFTHTTLTTLSVCFVLPASSSDRLVGWLVV
jgi:hypothetical protein